VAGSCEHDNETSGSKKGGGISRIAESLSASQGGLCVVKLVDYRFNTINERLCSVNRISHASTPKTKR
jgi:hypothetical protein